MKFIAVLLVVVLLCAVAFVAVTPSPANAFPGEHYCQWSGQGCVWCGFACAVAIIQYLNDGGVL